MFFSIIILRYDLDKERIDDSPFQDFAKNKDVLSVKEHFPIYRELPHLALCVLWRMPEIAKPAVGRRAGHGFLNLRR